MPRFGPWPGAGGGGGGGGGTVANDLALVGFDVSRMTGGSGTFGWQYSAKRLLPTDNLDARACADVVAFTGGRVLCAGEVSDAQFTTDGGKPVNGAPVYLAAATDDGATAAGKLTATRPRGGMPFPVYPQRFVQNAIRVGIVTDNANYDASKRCRVLLQLPTATSIDPPPPDEFFRGQEISNLSNTRFLSAVANDPQFDMAPGKTLVILFSVEDGGVYTGLDDLVSVDNPVTGNQWQLCGDAGGSIRMQWLNGFALVGQLGILGVPTPGLNCMVVSSAAAPGGVIAINGERVNTGGIFGAFGGIGPNSTIRLGGGLPGFNGWAPGGVYAIAMLERSMTQAEAIGVSAMIQPAMPQSRYVLPLGLLTDPTLLWHFNAFSWGAGAPAAVGGPRGLGFAWTVNGAVGRTGRSQQWYRSLAPLFVDSETAAVDARGYPRTGPGARLVFTAPTVADLYDLGLTITNDDFDNADNGGIAWFVNGNPQGTFPDEQQSDGLTQLFWLRKLLPGPLGAAPYTVQIVAPDKVFRERTFQTGACIVDLVAPADAAFAGHGGGADRLIIVGDDEAIGHDTPGSGGGGLADFHNSFTTLLRADFPGRVTCFAMTTGGIAAALDWGGGTVDAYARHLAETAQEGAPAHRTYYFQLGFNDYFFTFLTVAQFATGYGQLLDAVHALDPTGNYYAQRFIQAAFDATPNGNGETGANFNTAIAALTTGRPWLAVVNARVPNPITFIAAGRRPDQAGGTAAWKANAKAILGY